MPNKNTMKHVKCIDGVWVKKSRSTLVQAAEEFAERLLDAPNGKGQVIFTCPNYAIVKGLREHTIWAK
jgi:hypothetical protein